MVMDEKVQESFVLDTASVLCNYKAGYEEHPQYRGHSCSLDHCNIIASTPSSADHVALRDTGNQLTVTVSRLPKEEAGWRWCGIQRDFARDDVDFTELVVTDNRAALSNDFGLGNVGSSGV
ncbi:hypothetical protein MC885_011219 [Smutsia gigantea]|nr:hypothetical protein MC885_011219 [Smutsia gigantea]